jgi:hypothetical protein
MVVAWLCVPGLVPAQTNDPFVAVEPVGGVAALGETFAFSVEAGGTPPYAFQWYLSGPIAGATNASLLKTNLSTADAGDYFVVITNSTGTLTSRVASLFVVSGAPRVLWVQNVAPAGGDGVEVPLVFNANGRERSIQFSLQFDTNTFSQPLASWAAGFDSTEILTNAASGEIGFGVAPSGTDLFAAGQHVLGSIHFTLRGTNATYLDGRLAFADQPIPVQAADTNGLQMLLSAAVVPQIAFSPAQPVLNPTNGLFEQRVRIANPSANTFVNLPVYVPWLGTDTATNPMTLYDPSGTTNVDLDGDGTTEPVVLVLQPGGTAIWITKPVSYITVSTLASGGIVTITNAFYVTDHLTSPLVDYYVGIGGTPGVPMPATFAPLSILKAAFEGSDLVLEWPTRSGETYSVNYVDDLAGLADPGLVQTSTNTVTGAGRPVRWVDPAPSATHRFYQVVESP